MPYFTPAIVEVNSNGATNPRTGEVWDRFVQVRFATGARTELHDDGIIGHTMISETIGEVIHVDPISAVLRPEEAVDFLLSRGLVDPHMGPELPPGWPLRMDLSNEDAARLACRIVDPIWQVPSLPYRAIYPFAREGAHILVESDIGRFVVTMTLDCGRRSIPGSDLRAGTYLWWTGYTRFAPLAFL